MCVCSLTVVVQVIMSSVSFCIISSGASNSIVCSIIFFFVFSFFCSRLALVLYVVCRCCNKVSFKKKKILSKFKLNYL